MATTNIYSLSDHVLSIAPKDATHKLDSRWTSILTSGQSLCIGGTDSMVGQIRVSRPTDTWSTEADATGGFVHNKNYNRSGRITVSIRQVSGTVEALLKLANSYFPTKTTGAADFELQLTITNSTGKTIIQVDSAFLTKPADQAFGERAAQQDWVFTCGQIEYLTP